MTLDLDAIKERCKALDERKGKEAWTLEGPNQYGLFSVYDSDGNAISHGVEEEQAFIAHAHADVPALVTEVERLRRESRVRAKCLALAMEVLGWYASDVLIGRRANSVLGEISKHLAQLEPENEPAPDALPCAKEETG